MKEFFSKTWNSIKKFFSKVWNATKNGCIKAWKAVKGLFIKGFKAFMGLAKPTRIIILAIAGTLIVGGVVGIAIGSSVAHKKTNSNNNEPQGDGGGEAQTFTIVWKNGDEVLETDTNVTLGSMPVYNGKDPTKEDDEEFAYEWSGWSPSVVQVSADATYVATFTQVDKGAQKKHTIDNDGDLQTANRLRSTNFTTRLTKEGTADYYEVRALGSSQRNINFNIKYNGATQTTECSVAWCKKGAFDDMDPDWIGYKYQNKWSRSETMTSSEMFESEYYLDKGVGLYFDYIFKINNLSELVYMDSEQVYTKAITFRGSAGYLKLRYDDNVLVKATLSTSEGNYTQTFKKYGTTQVDDWLGLTEYQQHEQINQSTLDALLNPEYSSTDNRLTHASFDYDAKRKSGNATPAQATGSVKSEYKSNKLHYVISDSRFDGLLYYNGEGDGLKISWDTEAPYTFAVPTSKEASKAKYDTNNHEVRGYFGIVIQSVLKNIVGNAVSGKFYSEDYIAYCEYSYEDVDETDEFKPECTVQIEVHYTFENSVPTLSSLVINRQRRAGYVGYNDIISISNISFGDSSILSNSDYQGL